MTSKRPVELDVGENCNGLQLFETLEKKEDLSPRHVKQEILSPDSMIWRPPRHNPMENARGISEEYMALTKACIHDHDYYSLECKDLDASRENAPCIQRVRDSDCKPVEVGKPSKEAMVKGNALTNARARSRRIVRKSSVNLTNAASGPVIVKSNKSSEEAHNFLNIRECGEPPRMKVPSPRPSITPFPPVEKTRRNYDISLTRLEKKLENDDETTSSQSSVEDNQTCNKSTDSAYNSMTCSSTSRPYSANRPPSGGKRSATGGISSSSSSDLSSDECSDVERFTKNRIVVENSIERSHERNTTDEIKNDNERHDIPMTPMCHHPISRSGRKIRKHVQPSEDAKSALPTEESKLQYMPVPPPRKPKRGRTFRSVPMRLRALPTSFWEEPNQTNGSTYTLLPPVQPLLHYQDEIDITDVAPVSPVNEMACRQTAPSTSNDHSPAHRPIIKAGDTDLLLRLFDQFDSKKTTNGIQRRRGRSKRPAYANVPPPRTNGQNPCIIDSIADKLFPKLSLDSKHTLATLTRTTSRRTPCEIVGQDAKLSSTGKITDEIEEFSLHHRDDDIVLSGLNQTSDSRASSDASPMLMERPTRILPQLIPHKDYSQLLTELTAVL